MIISAEPIMQVMQSLSDMNKGKNSSLADSHNVFALLIAQVTRNSDGLIIILRLYAND